MPNTVRVAVTGAAGQVAYAMLGRLASGEIFGPNTKVVLHLLEITPAMPSLEGVAMELDDCGFPTLDSVVTTDDPARAFKDVNYALLVGSFPRKAGMERKELLYEGKAFAPSMLNEMLNGVPARLGPEAKYGLGVIIRPTKLGVAHGHSGFFPGYQTEMLYFPAHKFAVALQVNTSVRLSKSPLRALLELAEAIAAQ